MKKPFAAAVLIFAIIACGAAYFATAQNFEVYEPVGKPDRVTALSPAENQILLVNTARTARLELPRLPSGVYDGAESFINSNVLPKGFYAAGYIPEMFASLSFTGGYYINADNIDSLRNPIQSEENETGSYALYKAKTDYSAQVKNTALLGGFPDFSCSIGFFNFLESSYSVSVDFTDAETVKKRYSERGKNDLRFCETREIKSPLFEKAYLTHLSPKGRPNDDVWYFDAIKTLETPVTYYHFPDNARIAVTEENLKSYLVTADKLTFAIELIYHNGGPKPPVLIDEAEVMRIVGSVYVTG